MGQRLHRPGHKNLRLLSGVAQLQRLGDQFNIDRATCGSLEIVLTRCRLHCQPQLLDLRRHHRVPLAGDDQFADQGVHTVPRLRRARNRARLAQRQTLGERGLSAAEVGGQAVERRRVPPLAARRGQLKRYTQFEQLFAVVRCVDQRGGMPRNVAEKRRGRGRVPMAADPPLRLTIRGVEKQHLQVAVVVRFLGA